MLNSDARLHIRGLAPSCPRHMAPGRRTGGAGALAGVALVLLGTTALVFVGEPRRSGAPKHAQLRAGAALPPTAGAAEPAETQKSTSGTWSWSGASLLSVSAAFGLLVGVALGPQPAVAGLSDRISGATGTVEVPAAPKVEAAKPAPPPPPPAPKVEAPKVEAAKPAPPPPPPAPEAPKVEAAKPAPPPPPPAPKVEAPKPAPTPAPEAEAAKPAPEAKAAPAPKAKAAPAKKVEEKVANFFGMNTPENKRQLPKGGVYKPVKGPGDLFGNCGKRCAPNKPL